MDIVTRLKQLAHAVADEDWSEFSLRVPADSERDADLVLLRASKEIESLRAELAECKRDAERYRWIRGNVPSHSTRWSRWKVEYFYGASGWNDLRHAKLDAEIDAALAAKGK